jgi:hypothetical protein
MSEFCESWRPSAAMHPFLQISIAGLPVTGSDIFGREEDIAFLDDAWANQNVNVVTVVASSRIVEPCWFWMASSRSKIRLVRRKDGYVSLASRPFCANSPPSIWGFAWIL